MHFSLWRVWNTCIKDVGDVSYIQWTLHAIPGEQKLLYTYCFSRKTMWCPCYSLTFLTSPLSLANKINSGQRPSNRLVLKVLFSQTVDITHVNQVLFLGNLNYKIRRLSGKSNENTTERSRGRGRPGGSISK